MLEIKEMALWDETGGEGVGGRQHGKLRNVRHAAREGCAHVILRRVVVGVGACAWR